MAITQAQRAIAVSSPLGEDVLLFRRMTATEQLSQLFEFNLDLLSEDYTIELDKLLGQSVTVRLERPDGKIRYFNGIVSHFSYTGISGYGATARRLAAYRATLRPWLWWLTRTADCRIFQEKTVPEIIQQLFREHGLSDFEDALGDAYHAWEYCVQYRETDFNFVSRLMEHEGIYYYFKHESGKHTLVLSDSLGSHDPVSGYEEVPYFPPDEHNRRKRDHIYEWSVCREMQSERYALDDFDFTRPKVQLDATAEEPLEQQTIDDKEVYDYPGNYTQKADGDTYARVRLEETQALYEIAHGQANARGFSVGALFKLSEYPREDQNQEYLIVSATHELRSDEYETVAVAEHGDIYACRFSALLSRRPFRALRITAKPLVQGPQTAIVVGKQGEEIWTDEYGRVKVQFHWDREGKYDEKSSCWVRVAQVWAGKNWGGIHIPRIGQEVIVDFLEGDPDRPIITGRVYNADQMPPYGLPANQTQSGIKTRSSKDGSDQTFNELRFEDKKDAEEVYFHAERDFNSVVKNNDTLKVGFEKKSPGNQTIEIYNHRTATLGAGNDKLRIKKGDHVITIDAGKSTIQAAKSIELKVGGSSIKIEPAKITLKAPQIAIEASATVDVTGLKTTVNGNLMLKFKGGLITSVSSGGPLLLKGTPIFVSTPPIPLPPQVSKALETAEKAV